MRKTILIISFFLFLATLGKAQDTLNFKSVDARTYELYQEGEWKSLTVLAREAIREGIDYFYLRLRCGIAYYYMGNYRQAEVHLTQALGYNSIDRTTIEYLYYTYLMQKKGSEALNMLKQAPPSLKESLRENTPPRLNFIHLDGGVFLSDQDKIFRPYDLDGKDNIYGETDIINQSTYFSMGGGWFPSRHYSGYAGYTFLTVEKNKLVMSGDSIILDHPYQTNQHQLYINSSFYPGNGISITPAFHYIHVSENSVYASFDDVYGTYSFPDTAISMSNFIGFLSLKKDFNIVRAGVFGAMANLNNSRQYQAGFDVIAFPSGNLDLYAQAQFLAHINDGDLQPVVNVMAGAKILRPIWLEFSGSFGKVENYFADNASAVYNFAGVIRYKYGIKVIATLTKRLQLTLDYQYLGLQAPILTYTVNNSNGSQGLQLKYHAENYNQHLIIGSLLWKI